MSSEPGLRLIQGPARQGAKPSLVKYRRPLNAASGGDGFSFSCRTFHPFETKSMSMPESWKDQKGSPFEELDSRLTMERNGDNRIFDQGKAMPRVWWFRWLRQSSSGVRAAFHAQTITACRVQMRVGWFRSSRRRAQNH